ncbi:MAG: glycosyltransferase [Actinobacteria bacterium]|nr:glycosyltransferase [Actinomycetota bacterium]
MWLPEVVAALASQSRPIDYTVAVDTGSKDASVKLLKRARLHSISMPYDTGFGEAIAGAIKNIPAPLGENEWLWFIHDDCAPESGALQALLEAIENRPQVAIAGPKLRGWYDRSHLLELGVSIAGNGARWTGLENREYDQGQYDGVREVLSVSTAGMLIRRDVFTELGGFDPNLALFRDDVDLGWRAHVAGHSVIAVSQAVAFHAEAAASERRTIDVKSALLHHGLLLDRRNAAYVLLVNSSWWLLPWVALQLVSSATLRALGYLIAKLPSYALDEFLAVCLLVIKPRDVWAARKERRKSRLISPRVVSAFIPPRWSQIRLGAIRLREAVRFGLLPSKEESESSLVQPSDEDDLLIPSSPIRWHTFFRRPEISGFLFIIVLSSLWATQRYGSLVGGALPRSPVGAIDLWRKYADSWHEIGMGTSAATPTWIAILALMSTLFLGKAAALITIVFWAAPILSMWSMYSLLRRLSHNSWLVVGGALAYSLSPVTIAAINSGRLGTIVLLVVAPRIAYHLPKLVNIEMVNWRAIFGFSLLVGVVTSFSLFAFLGISLIHIMNLVRDYLNYRAVQEKKLFLDQFLRRLVLIFTPFVLCLPWSLETLLHPTRFLIEPGFALGGGGPNFALLANPGGPGSLPWWFISPVSLMLVVAMFSSAAVRRYSGWGLLYLILATYLSAVSLAGHASSRAEHLWVGSFLVFATIGAMCSGVIILDGLRKRLVGVQFHFRHMLGGILIASTVIYGLTTSVWAVTVGSDSPVQANEQSILPPFLAVSSGAKTLVLRTLDVSDGSAPSFYIARSNDAMLGDPDIASPVPVVVDLAIQKLVDGSGIGSSTVLSAFGIKYVFLKNPVDTQIARGIDGLGGFIRNSSTRDGIVWRVTGISDQLVLKDKAGRLQALNLDPISGAAVVPNPGQLLLAESYDSSWQAIQGGKRLFRTENADGLTEFSNVQVGEITVIHDGTTRRAWLALQVLVLLTVVIFALPSGRRRREISEQELT